MYGLKEDTRKFYSSQLGEDRSKAQRELGFQKARQGIIGSSQANDMDTQFQAANDRGLLDVANRADSAATQFRTADEQARLNLITKVVAGLDQGTAAQNAASTLRPTRTQPRKTTSHSAWAMSLLIFWERITKANICPGQTLQKLKGRTNTAIFL